MVNKENNFRTIIGGLAKFISKVDDNLSIYGFVRDRSEVKVPSEYVGLLKLTNYNSTREEHELHFDINYENSKFPVVIRGLDYDNEIGTWEHDIIIPHDRLIGLLKYIKLLRQIVKNSGVRTNWHNSSAFGIGFILYVNDDGLVDIIDGEICEYNMCTRLMKYKFTVGKSKDEEAHFWKRLIDGFVNNVANSTWNPEDPNKRGMKAVQCSTIPMVLSKDKEFVVMKVDDIIKLMIDNVRVFEFDVITNEHNASYTFRLELPNFATGKIALSKYLDMSDEKHIRIPFSELRVAEIFKQFGYELDGMIIGGIREFSDCELLQTHPNTISVTYGPYLEATLEDTGITKRAYVTGGQTFHQHVYDLLGINKLISAWESVSRSIDLHPYLVCRNDTHKR